MRILIDSGDITAIRHALDSGFVTGVTTNPSLLRRAGIRTEEVAKFARQAFDAGAQELHLQTYATDTPRMLIEARELMWINPARVCVCLPAIRAGYRAAARLAAEGVRVALSAVYTLPQALLAHSSGAHYIAINIEHMQHEGINALAHSRAMQTLLEAQQSSVQILAKQIRTTAELTEIAKLGVLAASLTPDLLDQLLDCDATMCETEQFSNDAQAML